MRGVLMHQVAEAEGDTGEGAPWSMQREGGRQGTAGPRPWPELEVENGCTPFLPRQRQARYWNFVSSAGQRVRGGT